MSRFTQALLHVGKNKEKQNMTWNMIGSFCYAAASMVLSFLVMRIIGREEGGIFSFAFSVFGQQMFLVAYFGIRPYQVTDGDYEFTFGDYLFHRKVTCAAAVVLGAAYLAVSGYSEEKAAVIFLMVLYKTADGFADVFESEFQRNGNLYLTGKSNAFRTLLSVSCFLVCLTATRRLVLSCAAAAAAQAAGVVIFDFVIIRSLTGIEWERRKGSCRKLFGSTLLLFISVFLDFYIFSAARYAIDANLNDAASGYFNAIFMPTSVINLAAGFVIRPFLTSLTEFWNRGRFKDFKALMGKIAAVIGGLTVLAVGGGWLLGRPVLGVMEILLGPEYRGVLTAYRTPFVVIVLGGGFYAVMNLMYYGLVIMRRQKEIFGVYAALAVGAYLLSNRMVAGWGIAGAAVCYLILMALLAAGFGLLLWASYSAGARKRGGPGEPRRRPVRGEP